MNMSEYKPLNLVFTICKPINSAEPINLPIILLHGIIGSKERWGPVQQALADKTKSHVYAIDCRNHGKSEHSEIFNFNILTKDLKHFMDSQNISKASFIGHSMGGLVVMDLALTEPEMVEKIVIEDVSPKEPVPELYYIFSAMIEEQLNCFSKSSNDDTEGSLNQKLRECIFRTVPMIPDEDLEVIKKMEFPMQKKADGFESLTNLKYILKAVQNPPIFTFPENHTFDGDILFIYGVQSNFSVLEDEDLIFKYFPNAKLHGFETAGHEICSRYPTKFTEVVSKFFS